MKFLFSARRFSRSPLALLVICLLCVAGIAIMSRNPPVAPPFSHYPSSLCAGNSTQVVLAIRTLPRHDAIRHVIRNSIAHGAVRLALPSWAFLFYMGFVRNSTRMDAVRGEIQTHGDLLVSPFESAVNNSVEIVLDMMRWVEDRCGKGRPLRLFVHVNDTVFVDPIALEGYLHQMNSTAPRPSFYCKPVKGVNVGRDPKGVNFVPRDLFRGPVFPPYCEGETFFINGSQLGPLYAASLYALHYTLLPQYVTGHMAVIADMGHVSIAERIASAGSGGKYTGRKVGKANLFITNMWLSMWKDTWLYSLYNQTRQTHFEKKLTEIIVEQLHAASN
ncbi:acetylgalactosaminyl-O-glycosyl-glycoprotein beta-1,3-N-acetylglucosaminyltransferase-like [Dermacentor andersoni]|uniref:acetylgalactosaminyl-O-glycosyl-glycoprotein beta-1,3-N-acetylglucosaminyltransferase-like n=1 Tax=Dermacentor andersoni TaxID=34620 RepID=UPI003B3AA63A